MLAADAEGREVCVSPKKKEGEVLLFGCDIKWRSGAAVVMKGSLALFLSRECVSMLPRTLSSLDSSFPTLYKFHVLTDGCGILLLFLPSVRPGQHLKRCRRLQSLQQWRRVEGRELVFSRSGRCHSIKSGLECAIAHPHGWLHSSKKPMLEKPSWCSETTSAWSFLAAL